VIQLLTSLNTQNFKDFTVLLVVNGNRRYFKKLQNKINDSKIFQCEINIIFNPTEKGVAHARNIALKNATTPYIAFTDDDVIPHADWLKMVDETFKNINEVGAVTGPIVANWDSEIQDFASWFPKELYWVIGCTSQEFPTLREVRNGFASNLALNREIALKCGGFNESFGYNQKYRMAGEEPEFCIKMRRIGRFTLWNPQMIVYHRVTPTRLEMYNLLTRSYIEGRSKAYLKKLFGNEATQIEAQQLQTIAEAILKRGSFRSKAYLASTTSAVAIGYLLTGAKIRMKQALKATNLTRPY
jgi:GT2 family glycosyltransferase